MYEKAAPTKPLESENPGARLLYSVPEVAQALGGITTRHVGNLIRSGQLRSVKLGRRRLVPAAALDEYVAQLEQAQAGVA